MTAVTRREQGSVLMLVPAGVLVLFVLGSIAVDFSIAFMAQREMTSAAAAAANDAAGAALSDETFYRDSTGGIPGRIVLDQRSAERFVAAALAARRPRGVTLDPPEVHTSFDQVCVTVTGRVDYIFAKAIPGGPEGRTVRGQAVATAVQGDGQPAVAVRTGGVCTP